MHLFQKKLLFFTKKPETSSGFKFFARKLIFLKIYKIFSITKKTNSKTNYFKFSDHLKCNNRLNGRSYLHFKTINTGKFYPRNGTLFVQMHPMKNLHRQQPQHPGENLTIIPHQQKINLDHLRRWPY